MKDDYPRTANFKKLIAKDSLQHHANTWRTSAVTISNLTYLMIEKPHLAVFFIPT